MILVVDDVPICREPLAACLEQAGYATACAADGVEGLQLIHSLKPDLVLLDVVMPRMDGISMLQKLRDDPLTAKLPVFLITGSSDRALILKAASLGVKEYILKSCFSMKDLLARLRKHLDRPVETASAGNPALPQEVGAASASPSTLAAAVTSSLSSRQESLDRAIRATKAKTLSGAISQVLAVAASPRGDAIQLAGLISRDPLLSSRILAAANSAAYASGRPCTTVGEAVRRIGFTTVRNICAAVGIFGQLPSSLAGSFSVPRCWQHSFAVAHLCEQIEHARGTKEAGQIYIIGLCHDVGELILRSEFEKEYAHIEQLTLQTCHPREEVQLAALGISHAELLAAAIKQIGLPEQIYAPIELYLRGGESQHEFGRRAELLRLANAYANGLFLSTDLGDFVRPFSRTEIQGVMGQAEPPRIDPRQFAAEVRSLTAMLAKIDTADQLKALLPPQLKAAKKVYYACDPKLSSFDPIHAALSTVAEVRVCDRLTEISAIPDDAVNVAVTIDASKRAQASVGLSELASELRHQTLWIVCASDGERIPDILTSSSAISLNALLTFVDSGAWASEKASAGLCLDHHSIAVSKDIL